MRERYLIAKNLNTSFLDTGKLTPKEREYLINFLITDMEKRNNK